MNDVIAIRGAAMTPAGYGSTLLGQQPWPAGDGESADGQDLVSLSWNDLFDAPCSRFGRMDLLSRAGLMGAELLDIDFGAVPEQTRNRIGVCLQTRSGTLSTDMEFLADIGPSTFIYTLPSSVIGEICIRHVLRGPSLCLMSESSSGRNIVTEAVERIATGEADAMLCLSCEATAPSARSIVRSTLVDNNDFWWYVYAVYVVRSDLTEEPGIALPTTSGNDIEEMDRLCLRLCGGA